MKKLWKRLLIVTGIITTVILVVLIGLIIFLSVTEYKPSEKESVTVSGQSDLVFANDTVTVLSWNTGYAGLDANADFFMDGGTRIRPTDEYFVNVNMNNMGFRMQEMNPDFILLQEVDRNSARTYGIDQLTVYETQIKRNSAFAYNYHCPFVPIPFPPLGRMESGIVTLTGYQMENAERISLPCPFSWPVSTANLKRCLLVTRTPIEGSGKELVVVNLHLEAYDRGEGKVAQTNMLISVLEEEYEKGNYVIAGGDFNQAFPGSLEQYPIKDPKLWIPDVLKESILPAGWQYAFDNQIPTCRLLNEPYNEETTQHYVLDGFIVSPNVEIISVSTIDEDFFNSDHNPVLLEVRLKGQ